jgi:hypothetical protein
MEYSINIHAALVQRKSSEELFINKLPRGRVTMAKTALIHLPEVLEQEPNHPLHTESRGDLGFAS